MRHFVTGFGLATVALFVSAAPAAAQSQQPSQRARADANANAQERTICMRVQTGGSRISRRVCRTEREWQARGELDNDPR